MFTAYITMLAFGAIGLTGFSLYLNLEMVFPKEMETTPYKQASYREIPKGLH
jgi:hypothetical protein